MSRRPYALPTDRADVPQLIGTTAARGMGRSAFSVGLAETVSHNVRVDWWITSAR